MFKLIVASLGPSAIDSVYTLKLCDTRGCDDGYLVFGVFSAASKDRSGSEKSANALNDGYSDLVNVVYPRDLGKNLVNDSKIPAGLILAALLVQVLVLGFLGAGVHSIFAYNRGLSHGFQIPELIPKRDRGLALLV